MNYPNTVFRSPRTLSILAVVGLGSVVLCHFLAAFLGIAQIIDPQRAIDLDGGDRSIWLLGQSLLALANVAAFLGAVVFFLIWLFRVHKNLDALAASNREFTPGWAVAWWFIPFAKLVKP